MKKATIFLFYFYSFHSPHIPLSMYIKKLLCIFRIVKLRQVELLISIPMTIFSLKGKAGT